MLTLSRRSKIQCTCMAFTFPYLTLSIWRCCKFLVIEAKSLQEERRVLDRSSSDISELMLRDNQDKTSFIMCRKSSMGDTFGISILSWFNNDLTIPTTCSISDFWPDGQTVNLVPQKTELMYAIFSCNTTSSIIRTLRSVPLMSAWKSLTIFYILMWDPSRRVPSFFL